MAGDGHVRSDMERNLAACFNQVVENRSLMQQLIRQISCGRVDRAVRPRRCHLENSLRDSNSSPRHDCTQFIP
jgi:hypothetical protein